MLLSVSAPVRGAVENLGCDPGWIDGGNGYCYYAQTTRTASQQNAKMDCSNKGATLLQIIDTNELVSSAEH